MWTFLAKVENVDLFADNCLPTAQTRVAKARAILRGYGGMHIRKFMKNCTCILSLFGARNDEIFKQKSVFFHFFKHHMILREFSPIKRRGDTKSGILL